MTEMVFLDLVKEAIWLTLLLATPVLLVALAVGLLVSLFQAVTQIQEATLTFVPKILACLLTLVMISPWMLSVFLSHSQNMLRSLATIAHM
ncbi:MAG: flagellar biosynthesis protein FliQ [Cyanobacteria bacterium HKST-UBA06]|nr:flagellar biosynthesis protein FliQ [Cyanobacteria bacterium HKST-UBA05]MCA9798208.1 flagellar biosynthesis protein FliQ [Cyanobacteria bacterium HKST-UBA04]MCA9807584.1 flagellar biosynthesis protein FliQ [Cyanobacteria bacterium HKST-UBA06]MCA9840748.1 flagellar biosynthesis protein FliQ [Cyanobacteria bacterium HKST-UBA03]